MTVTLRREVLALVALVLSVDAAFVAAYFLAHIRSTGDGGKLTFTTLWTLATLAVVVRGLSRIRGTRRSPGGTRG